MKTRLPASLSKSDDLAALGSQRPVAPRGRAEVPSRPRYHFYNLLHLAGA